MEQQRADESSDRPSILYCPMGRPFTPCDVAELRPIVEHLQSGAPVEDCLTFLRGTHLADGRVDLCKQRIGPVGAEWVSDAARGHEQSRHLLLGANGLGDRGARAVAGLVRQRPGLRTIYLGCNAIGAEGAEALAEALAENDQVTGVWLKRNPLGPRGYAALAAMLRRNRTIRTLDLVHTLPGEEGLRALVEALAAGVSAVRRLYLGGNRLGPAEAPLLAELLRQVPLHSLYLGVNRLGDEGTRIVAEGLRNNSSLQWLALSSNGIGPEGAWALAAAAQDHPRLAVVELGYDKSTPVLGESPNQIGDAGCSAIADWLVGAERLRALDLRRNGITGAGVALLVDALRSQRTLTSLRLGRGVGVVWRRRVDAMLRRNADEQGVAVDSRPVVDPAEIEAIRSVYRS